ncbi:TPA: hypothetical protein HA318_05665 [Candidatus Micrarchaeota archaeon]|nr:MAG: hypothetical protein AUJ65_01440 [Candidatus Micrarchaeota archaeon CG1_02_51_15]HII39458.1 hypothetical protein [Candidatus Micrarchaeota archaeon]
MSFLTGLIEKVKDSIAETIRKFTAYSMALFFIGSIYGAWVMTGHLPPFLSSFVQDPLALLLIPLLLALLAYVSTEIAVIIFVSLFGLMLIFFL